MSGIILRDQVSTFVLFLVARVGSTYLTSVLASHPQITALGEELRDREKDGATAQLDWSRKFLTPPLVGRHRSRGFNVKLVHLADRDAFAELLREKNCRILHMARRNRIKSVVSRMNGSRLFDKTGMWGLFDKSNRPPALTVDLAQFDEYLRHRERVDRELEDYVGRLGLRTLNLYYEDMLRDEDGFLKKLYAFLDVDPHPVKGQTLKITSDDLRQAIVNFDEVHAQYKGTEYEPMFDEVIIP